MSKRVTRYTPDQLNDRAIKATVRYLKSKQYTPVGVLDGGRSESVVIAVKNRMAVGFAVRQSGKLSLTVPQTDAIIKGIESHVRTHSIPAQRVVAGFVAMVKNPASLQAIVTIHGDPSIKLRGSNAPIERPHQPGVINGEVSGADAYGAMYTNFDAQNEVCDQHHIEKSNSGRCDDCDEETNQ